MVKGTCVCGCVGVFAYSCVSRCTWRLEDNLACHSSGTFHLVFWDGSFTGIWVLPGRLAGRANDPQDSNCISSTGIMSAHHHQAFMWVWGIKCILVRPTFYQLSHLSSLFIFHTKSRKLSSNYKSHVLFQVSFLSEYSLFLPSRTLEMKLAVILFLHIGNE